MTSDKAQKLWVRLKSEAEASGYLLHSDDDLVADLMEGLQTNLERYGYMACPCRLADGVREKDLDIICPCDYRDPDLVEHDACYCGLYVSPEVQQGTKKLKPIPDRREDDHQERVAPAGRTTLQGDLPVHRCKVCGYLCARDQPPGKCPVCKADADRFELFGAQESRASMPVHRCKVCGYLCARDQPPGKCPICKADADRFEPFG